MDDLLNYGTIKEQESITGLKAMRMRLFAGTSEQFLEDTVQNQIAEKLRLAFFSY
jgi:hypothetical protein